MSWTINHLHQTMITYNKCGIELIKITSSYYNSIMIISVNIINVSRKDIDKLAGIIFWFRWMITAGNKVMTICRVTIYPQYLNILDVIYST